MHRPLLHTFPASLLGALLLLTPGLAHAQRTGGDENPIGVVLGVGSGVAPLMALPVLLDPGHLPRPGTGVWHVGLGYQSEPDSVAIASSAGGYFGAAQWLGLESRADSRADGSTGLDFHVDASYLLLLRPTPAAWPFWVEALAGVSFEAGFGANWPAYATAGSALGLRTGHRFALAPGVRLVLEAEVLSSLRAGDGLSGPQHQLEAAARAVLSFDAGDGLELGVALDYRREQAIMPSPTLPDTHRATLGLVIAWGAGSPSEAARSAESREVE